MAAQAARVIEYAGNAAFDAAIDVGALYPEPAIEPQEIPIPAEHTAPRTRAETATQKARGISLFSILGSIFAASLMVFVVLAQINYNEIASETARLSAQLESLTEQERRLEITFESVIDMKEVELYARDVLGMSKPDPNQISIIENSSQDKAEIIDRNDEEDALRDFGSFISSLFEYFR
ncbi:MAG: hypothetical protein LBH28_05785 [Oscillospiraceae bacterium]|jgi:cell division protein FtsL|nr:hypothetical protein [Oscillospiraceae bacterium]